MKSLHFSRSDANSNASTEYCPVENGGIRNWDSAENFSKQIVSTAGTFRNARVKLSTSPGAGNSYTYTLRLNGADTGIVMVVSDAETTEVDSTNEVAVVAGDIISWQCVPASTPTVAIPSLVIEFEGDNANESLVLASTNGSTGDGYVGFKGAHIPQATYVLGKQLISTAGVVSDLYVETASAVSDAFSVTLYKNGIATALTVALIATQSSGNDTVNTVTVAAGDTLAWLVTGIGTQPQPWFGALFTATTDDEFPICAGTGTDPGDTGDDFAKINQNHGATASGTESNEQQVTNALILKDLYALVSTAPGSGNSWTLTLRDTGADTALSASITGTNTTGSDTSDDVTVDDGDLLAIEIHPSDPGTEPTLPGEISWAMTGTVVDAAVASGHINIPILGAG